MDQDRVKLVDKLSLLDVFQDGLASLLVFLHLFLVFELPNLLESFSKLFFFLSLRGFSLSFQSKLLILMLDRVRSINPERGLHAIPHIAHVKIIKIIPFVDLRLKDLALGPRTIV